MSALTAPTVTTEVPTAMLSPAPASKFHGVLSETKATAVAAPGNVAQVKVVLPPEQGWPPTTAPEASLNDTTRYWSGSRAVGTHDSVVLVASLAVTARVTPKPAPRSKEGALSWRS
jgi:hypothetical protein